MSPARLASKDDSKRSSQTHDTTSENLNHAIPTQNAFRLIIMPDGDGNGG